ncbi:UNVERIFIED_CONTAM: hypothetical protein HDU68_000665 [Siphonaria sp. JEL0065]|nr:hypothetical protein HDU68_000665 [Siphonaria sp. JEL0065]
MEELKEFTNEVVYESYRTAKLAEFGGDLANANDKKARDTKMAKMEAEMKAMFDAKVAEKEAKLKQAEEELYARHREMKEQLERQRTRSPANQKSVPQKKGFFNK